MREFYFFMRLRNRVLNAGSYKYDSTLSNIPCRKTFISQRSIAGKPGIYGATDHEVLKNIQSPSKDICFFHP